MEENVDVMSEKIKESFGTLLEYVEKGAGFAAEQAPLVVQELIAWGFWNHAIGAVVALCVVVLIGFALRRLCPVLFAEYRKDYREQSEGFCILGTLGLIAALITAVVSAYVAVGNFKMLVMASVAPRVFLIEKIRDMLN